jgi:hypothetical protein
MLCRDFTDVEVEASIIPFLFGWVAEFDPEATLRHRIGGFRCGGCARGNGKG